MESDSSSQGAPGSLPEGYLVTACLVLPLPGPTFSPSCTPHPCISALKPISPGGPHSVPALWMAEDTRDSAMQTLNKGLGNLLLFWQEAQCDVIPLFWWGRGLREEALIHCQGHGHVPGQGHHRGGGECVTVGGRLLAEGRTSQAGAEITEITQRSQTHPCEAILSHTHWCLLSCWCWPPLPARADVLAGLKEEQLSSC